MRTLETMGPAKLQAQVRERIRAAADGLFVAEDIGAGPDAREAVAYISGLCRQLVESERWLDDTARRLLDDVIGCGPLVAA